jgi:glycine/D-amino acid oxidase-like deaminating enzyme/nitrite reductase/ring-hydroxylating ferredoxin subunit
MGAADERNRSVWWATADVPGFAPLGGDATTDVVVVGAGLTGLTTALLLKDAGASVIVVEEGRVASGSSGSNTAKVTALHGLTYAQLLRTVGPDKAQQYADANSAAVELVASLDARLGGPAGIERQAAYTYTTDEGRVPEITAEVEAATALGLPASFETTTALPYPVAGAIRLAEQLQLHPVRYCAALAAAVDGDGSSVHEGTRALDVDERDGTVVVRTDRGEIHAGQAVLATLLPFDDVGGFFAKTAPYRSYALAVQADVEVAQGMYLGIDSPTRTVRRLPVQGDDRLLLGGHGHKAGQGGDTRRYYDELEAWARSTFGARVVEHRWSAQDYVSADSIPYVGRTPRRARTSVACGFKKWGLSGGTAAAMVLADTLQGRTSPWAEVFDATRINPGASARELVKENVDVGRRFITDRLAKLRAPASDALSPGAGAVVDIDGNKVAAFRDEGGAVHAVSATCTHLGCTVKWNPAERSWDCPCHGSRFAADGRVLNGPAVEDLRRVGPDADGGAR